MKGKYIHSSIKLDFYKFVINVSYINNEIPQVSLQHGTPDIVF